MEHRAHATYQGLLPHWEIVPIGASSVIEFSGGPHCVVQNLYRIKHAVRRSSRATVATERGEGQSPPTCPKARRLDALGKLGPLDGYFVELLAEATDHKDFGQSK